jgi:hypothetical protein
MRYFVPAIGLLCFMWLTIGALLAGRGVRTWQLKAEALMGLSGMAFCGLILYLRWSPQSNAHYIEKGLLAGVTFGIFIALWLEGSWNLVKRFGKSGKPRIGI